MTLDPSRSSISTNRRNDRATKVAAADAYVFVTPEYNFGPPPPLSSALNYLYEEWTINSPDSVSYSGISGGLRALQVASPFFTFRWIARNLGLVTSLRPGGSAVGKRRWP